MLHALNNSEQRIILTKNVPENVIIRSDLYFTPLTLVKYISNNSQLFEDDCTIAPIDFFLFLKNS